MNGMAIIHTFMLWGALRSLAISDKKAVWTAVACWRTKPANSQGQVKARRRCTTQQPFSSFPSPALATGAASNSADPVTSTTTPVAPFLAVTCSRRC